MNKYILSGTYNRFKGHLRIWWGKLIGNKEDQSAGMIDKLSGDIQVIYGKLKNKAEIKKLVPANVYRKEKLAGADRKN